MADIAFALDVCLAQIDRAGLLKFSELLQSLALRLKHGVDEMQAAFRIGEDVRDEKPLVDLEAFLGALLLEGSFAVNALACRQQSRKTGGDRVQQIADSQRLAATVGDHVVDFAGVPAQKLFPGRA